MNLGDDSTKTLEKVVPRLYVGLPKTGPADVVLAEENHPVQRPFLADLWILYGFDLGTHYELVSQKDLARLGVAEDELFEHALNNLRLLEPQVQAHQGERVTMLTAGGNYEATLLLLPEVWESVAPLVTGRIVASVPARNMLLLTGDSEPENLAELRKSTSAALELAQKPLSRAFLVWSGSEWEEYRGFGD